MWESGGVAPLILKLGATMEMNSQLHAPAALLTGKQPPVPIR